MSKLCSLRNKFNDILNEEANRHDSKVMFIKSCDKPEHFDHYGNLTGKGKITFWFELDDLLNRFNANKVKLLPKLTYRKNRQASARTDHSRMSSLSPRNHNIKSEVHRVIHNQQTHRNSDPNEFIHRATFGNGDHTQRRSDSRNHYVLPRPDIYIHHRR